MRKYRYTGSFALIAIVAAVFLYFLKGTEVFPRKILVIFWPAEFVQEQLRTEVGKGNIRNLLGNVSVFSILVGIEGAIVGFLLDSFVYFRRAALRRRVKYLSYSKDPVDLAFRRRVLELISKYDPAALFTITTDEDAYRPEAELILDNLKHMLTAGGLQRFCRRNFRRHFGRRAIKSFDRYDALARDIWSEYKQLRSSPRYAPPTTHGV